MDQAPTVIIVDPNPNSRLDTAEAVLRANLELLGECGYGTEASVLAVRQHPDVALLAIEDPPARAITTLRALQRLSPETVVISYSSLGDVAMMRQAMRHGARDYLVRPVQPDALGEAVASALSQELDRREARGIPVELPTARGTIVTVHSPKGGVGKTTISANLALALRQITQQEVVLVDADAQFGDVALMLDVEVTRGIGVLARNEYDLTPATIEQYVDHHANGLSILGTNAEPEDWRALGPDNLGQIVNALAEKYEYVLIDTPGSLNEVVEAALMAADLIVLVTSRDVSSVKDARATIAILDGWGIPRDRVRLVINDSTNAPLVTAAEAEHTIGLPATTALPYDRQVDVALQTGAPVVLQSARSRFSEGMFELARLISGVAGEPRRRTGLLSAIGMGGRRGS
ncbi:MAG: AAA family ATPase [Dehalococcoidia bacterium]